MFLDSIWIYEDNTVKKLFLLICVIVLYASILSACATDASDLLVTENSSVPVSVGVLKGPTAIGIVQFMDEADNGRITTNKYSFDIAGSVVEIIPRIVKGTLDIAAVPANLSSVLYNNTQGAVQVLAINTLGMIYIVEANDTISSVEDLRGKTILASGKGAPQEFALNYILSSNGIDPERDFNIEWKSEHTEVVTSLLTRTNSIALLPQPFVTTAQMLNENIRVAIDLNEEWDNTQQAHDAPSALIMSVMIARADFVRQNPQVISDFLDHYAISVEFVNNNVNEAAALVGQYGIVPEAVAQRAIPYCNITFIEGHGLKEKLSGYLRVLYEQNPQSVGGALPSDEFYFSR